jgi:hypothetical protein
LLESVLLDEDATKDLERRFQTVFDDDEAPMVNGLDYSRHPERQQILSRPQILSTPGRGARAFVDTMQRMSSIDNECLDMFRQQLHLSDCESDAENDLLLSDTESRPIIHEDMWADDNDDAASLTLPKPKPKPKAKPDLKPKAKTAKKTVPKTPAAPRGRPRKNAAPVETPRRQARETSQTPPTKTPNWRVSGLAQEGGSSSPPPTDPRFHVASQADTIGSDDTIGDEMQDTQAYKLDSELASFIVEDEDDVDVPASSLPSLDLAGLGRGTQAVVKAAQSKRAPKAEKIFTSDPTDDDAVVSSDSDDDALLVRKGVGASKSLAFVVDSASEDEEQAPVVSRQRARRVIEDDEDDE